MTERYGCKLRPYIYVADVPNHSVDADAYGIFQPRVAADMNAYLIAT